MIWSESIITHNAKVPFDQDERQSFRQQRELLVAIAILLYNDAHHSLTRREVEDYLIKKIVR